MKQLPSYLKETPRESHKFGAIFYCVIFTLLILLITSVAWGIKDARYERKLYVLNTQYEEQIKNIDKQYQERLDKLTAEKEDLQSKYEAISKN